MIRPPPSETLKLWSKVAALSFGGPAAQISVMHRLVVEERKWVTEDQFLHALNFCMLLPGPEAQQLATYLGWKLGGVRGGLTAGGLFILPGILVIMALSLIYLAYGHTPMVAGAFFGLKAAVLAIVAQAVHGLARKALKTRLAWIAAAIAFAALFAFDIPFPIIILAAAATGVAAHRGQNPDGHTDDHAPAPPLAATIRTAATWLALWLGPVAGLWAVLGRDHILTQIAVFFATIAAITFGGAYSILAWVAQEAVMHFHWLSHGQMLDGLGLAETTPGPLIMVLQFIGFMAAAQQPGSLPPMLAGLLGGLTATWVTFTPCFLWIFTGAPYMERLRRLAPLTGALRLVTAAVVGVIFNLALWFGIHTLFHQTQHVRIMGGLAAFDWPIAASIEPAALGLTVLALAMTLWLRLGMMWVLLTGVGGGLLLQLGGGLG